MAGNRDNTDAVAPLLLTVRALIAGTSEPVKGLFIAFKLIKRAEGTGALVEGVLDPLKGIKPKDVGGKARYSRILEEYRKQEAETVDDPSQKFVLGITDVDGYLEPVYDNTNPWSGRLSRTEPDTFKFALGETYSALYIRHPSPDVARAATQLLNGGASGRDDVDFSDTAIWGSGAPTMQSFTVEQGSGSKGEQFVIRLPDKPGAYVPLRKDGADKWWLYAHMPHGSLSSVKNQVSEFTRTLGALKYPASGHQESPYTSDTPVFHGPLQAATARFQEHLSIGQPFEPTDWAKAHQKNSWASEIGRLVRWDPIAVPKLEEKGIVGPETERWVKHWISNLWIKPPEHLIVIKKDGVLMLARGAFAFNAWSELAQEFGCQYGMKSGHAYRSLGAGGGGGALKHSIHKSGLAADMTGGRRRTTKPEWPVRFEAEFRLLKVALATLEKKLQQKQAALEDRLAARDKDRSKAEKKWNEAKAARDALSDEASDRQVKKADRRVTEAEKGVERVDQKHEKKIAKATTERDAVQKQVDDWRHGIVSDARSPNQWRMRFRVYGHSKADVFNTNAAQRILEINKLKAAIVRWAGLPSTDGASSTGDTGGLDGTHLAFLKKTYFEGVSSPLLDDWLVKQFRPIYDFAKELVGLEDNDLVDRYFRPSVAQWKVNFYERDGGTDMEEHPPTHSDEDFPKPSWEAKSWLNLSALGHGCQMHRIPPHKWPTRDQTSLYLKTPEKVPPHRFPMAEYLKYEEHPAEKKDIVAAIEDITASSTQAPELARGEFQIQFRLPTRRNRTELDAEAMPDEIDGPFFKNWRRKISSVNAPVYNQKSTAGFRPKGAEIAIVLNELEGKRRANLDNAIKFFRSDFSDKRFVVLESGSLVDDELPTDKMFTGVELSDAINRTVVRLAGEAAIAKIQASSPGGPEEPSSRKKKKSKKNRDPKPRTKQDDWSILLQPVFAKDPEKTTDLLFRRDHIVLLPARENAAHLEWWHFQHHSVAKAGTWGALMEECGYSKAVLGTPDDGNPDPKGEPVHAGLGYTSDEIGGTPWLGREEMAARPTNYDRPTDEAVEDLDFDVE